MCVRVAFLPSGLHFNTTYIKCLFYNRWSYTRHPCICRGFLLPFDLSGPHFPCVYLKLRVLHFTGFCQVGIFHLPNGINNTCPTLIFGFIKRATTVPHKTSDLQNACAVTLLTHSLWQQGMHPSLDEELHSEVYNDHITREQWVPGRQTQGVCFWFPWNSRKMPLLCIHAASLTTETSYLKSLTAVSAINNAGS